MCLHSYVSHQVFVILEQSHSIFLCAPVSTSAPQNEFALFPSSFDNHPQLISEKTLKPERSHRQQKAMAAPNQPNSVLPDPPDPNIGSPFDFVLNLSRMIVAVKDIDRDSRTCLICREQYADTSPDGEKSPVKLICGHTFDLGCLLNWLSMNSDLNRTACPTCRRVLFYRFRPKMKIDFRDLRLLLDAALDDAHMDHQKLRADAGAGKLLMGLVLLLCSMYFFPRATMRLMAVLLSLGAGGCLLLLLERRNWDGNFVGRGAPSHRLITSHQIRCI